MTRPSAARPEGGANWDEGRFKALEDDRGFVELMAHPWFEWYGR
jgi:hypothetical protein